MKSAFLLRKVKMANSIKWQTPTLPLTGKIGFSPKNAISGGVLDRASRKIIFGKYRVHILFLTKIYLVDIFCFQRTPTKVIDISKIGTFELSDNDFCKELCLFVNKTSKSVSLPFLKQVRNLSEFLRSKFKNHLLNYVISILCYSGFMQGVFISSDSSVREGPV